MNFDQYQSKAAEFAQYADHDYPFLALAEETGEFLGIIAKTKRGDDLLKRYGTPEGVRQAVKKEAGDILWQLSQCLKELGISMQEVAVLNIEKLEDRKARNVIKGAGDDR